MAGAGTVGAGEVEDEEEEGIGATPPGFPELEESGPGPALR